MNGKNLLGRFLNQRFRALVRKEFNQIRRDRRLVLSLILPPLIQLLLFGSVLSPAVTNLRLGVVDEDSSMYSRELIAALSQSKSFRLSAGYYSVERLGQALERDQIDAGIVIPYDFSRNLVRGRPTTVQVLVNAINANTAEISRGYIEGVIDTYNRGLAGAGIHADFQRRAAPEVSDRGQVGLHPAFLYNPGLATSWFIVTGLFGLLLIMNGSIAASTMMVKEREAGTLEQLLMTPADTSEIIIAKIAPLFALLCVMTFISLGVMKIAFDVPFRGSVLLVFCGAALCLLSGIGIGTFIATFTRSAQQAQLTSFFINPPLSSLSGALTPVEAMPHLMQPLTVINPIYHFGVIARATLIKGSGLAALWPHFLALLAFTVVLVSLSVWRFRKQLS